MTTTHVLEPMPMSDAKARMKWETWSSLKGMSKEDAIASFVKKIEELKAKKAKLWVFNISSLYYGPLNYTIELIWIVFAVRRVVTMCKPSWRRNTFDNQKNKEKNCYCCWRNGFSIASVPSAGWISITALPLHTTNPRRLVSSVNL